MSCICASIEWGKPGPESRSARDTSPGVCGSSIGSVLGKKFGVVSFGKPDFRLSMFNFSEEGMYKTITYKV